jgi:hypothetical protein
MPAPSAAPMSAGETTAEAAAETVDEPAVETVSQAMVDMGKSSRHHDRGPEPKKPRLGSPVRMIEGIVVVIGIRIAIRIFARRGNDVDLQWRSWRILGDPPAPIGLLTGLYRPRTPRRRDALGSVLFMTAN